MSFSQVLVLLFALCSVLEGASFSERFKVARMKRELLKELTGLDLPLLPGVVGCVPAGTNCIHENTGDVDRTLFCVNALVNCLVGAVATGL